MSLPPPVTRRLRPRASVVPEAGEGEEEAGAPQSTSALLPRDVGPGVEAGDPQSPPSPRPDGDDELLTAPCCYCQEGLVFRVDPPRGWIHQLGGFLARRCLRCGVTATTWPVDGPCPLCSSPLVVDDHCATPDRSRA